MSWIRLGDEFVDDPAINDLGNDEAIAGWTYIRLLSYSARHLTDGLLPTKVVDREDPVGVAGLLRVGLLEPAADRYFLPRFLADHHPSREEALRLRAARAQAGRKGAARTNATRAAASAATGGATSAAASAAASDAASDAATGSANGTPRPVPSRPVSRFPSSSRPVTAQVGVKHIGVDRA